MNSVNTVGLYLDSDSGVSLLELSEAASLLQELVTAEALQPDTAQTLKYKYMGKYLHSNECYSYLRCLNKLSTFRNVE